MPLRHRFLVLVLLLTIVSVNQGFAQSKGQPADLFDFWVGDWDVTWKKADGTIGKGRNRVEKILDGKVLEEQFEAFGTEKAPGLKGRSLSVLHKGSQSWKQTWTDNQGGYYSLTGIVDGDKRMFMTDVTSRNGKELAQRMVFHSIKKDALTWDWENTTDGGKTWKLQWRIDYKRRSPAESGAMK